MPPVSWRINVDLEVARAVPTLASDGSCSRRVNAAPSTQEPDGPFRAPSEAPVPHHSALTGPTRSINATVRGRWGLLRACPAEPHRPPPRTSVAAAGAAATTVGRNDLRPRLPCVAPTSPRRAAHSSSETLLFSALLARLYRVGIAFVTAVGCPIVSPITRAYR